MAVRDPDLLQTKAMLLHGTQNQIEVAPRIDDCRLKRLIVPDQRTVLLEGGDGDGLVLQHPSMLKVLDTHVQNLNLEFGWMDCFGSHDFKVVSLAIAAPRDLFVGVIESRLYGGYCLAAGELTARDRPFSSGNNRLQTFLFNKLQQLCSCTAGVFARTW